VKSLLLLLLLTPTSSDALTLEKALKLGVDNSVELQKAESERKKAVQTKRQLVGQAFPKVQAVASGERRSESTTFSSLTTGNLISTDKETYSTYLELNQPLLSGGGLWAGVRLGRITEAQAEQNYRREKQKIIGNILRAYFLMAEREAQLKSNEENIQLLQSYLKEVRRYRRIGRTRNMDMLQASANLKLSLADLQDSETELLQAKTELAELIFWQGDLKEFNATTEFSIQPIEDMTEKLVLKKTLAQNPEAQWQELEVLKTKAQNRLTSSKDLPSLNLRALAGYTSPDRERLYESTSEYNQVGLVFTMPLFSGLTGVAQHRLNKEAEFQAKKDLQLKKRQLTQKAKDVRARMASRYSQVVIANEAAEEAKKALSLANNGLKRGLSSTQDIVNFQRSRFDAERRLIRIQFSYLRELLELRELMGIDLEEAYAKAN
jgi:outer membrane protein TolC